MQDEYLELRQLGLSKLAIACYRSLYEDGSTHVGVLAKRLGKLPNGLHRVLAKLNKLGFIETYQYETGWSYHVALPLFEVLVAYQAHQRLALNALIRLQEQQALAPIQE